MDFPARCRFYNIRDLAEITGVPAQAHHFGLCVVCVCVIPSDSKYSIQICPLESASSGVPRRVKANTRVVVNSAHFTML